MRRQGIVGQWLQQSPPRQEEQAVVPVPAGQLPFSAHSPSGVGPTSFSNVAFDSHSLIRSSASVLIEQYWLCANSEGTAV